VKERRKIHERKTDCLCVCERERERETKYTTGRQIVREKKRKRQRRESAREIDLGTGRPRNKTERI
jgi:hypothetical protein